MWPRGAKYGRKKIQPASRCVAPPAAATKCEPFASLGAARASPAIGTTYDDKINLLTSVFSDTDYRTRPYLAASLLLFSQLRVGLRSMPIPLVDFTGIGENATDVVLRLKAFPARDGKTDTVSREIRLGGQVATAVFAVARWGLRTRYVGVAGSDHHAVLHKVALRKEQVESHLLRVPSAESRLSY